MLGFLISISIIGIEYLFGSIISSTIYVLLFLVSKISKVSILIKEYLSIWIITQSVDIIIRILYLSDFSYLNFVSKIFMEFLLKIALMIFFYNSISLFQIIELK